MNINNILKINTELLQNNNVVDAQIIAKELLCYLLNCDRSYLIINYNKNVDEIICSEYSKMINLIINGIPLQYITNKQEFMKLNFYVDKNVLIPQPDTEILVEQVIKICNENYKNNISVLDLCTGSGCIAISIDKYINCKYKKIFASDISDNALKVAIKNNINNSTNVSFIKSDIFSNILDGKFDIIVSNPPYIETNVIKTLANDVQAEPNIALDGGIDGLKFYNEIIDNAWKFINKHGYLCLEIGYNQKKSVMELLNISKKYNNIECIKDLSGNDRCIIAKRMEE